LKDIYEALEGQRKAAILRSSIKMSHRIHASIPQKQDASEVPKMSRALAPDQPVVDHQAPTKDTPSVTVANTGNVAARSVKGRARAASIQRRRSFMFKMYEEQTKMFESQPNTPYMTSAEIIEKLCPENKSSK
jgi:hypothetical protein